MGIFLEGVEAIRQPCTLPILLSSLVFVLAAGRRAPIAAGAFVAGVALVAWLRFASILSIDLTGASAVAGGVLVAGAAIAVGLRSAGRCGAVAVAAASALGGAVVAAIWRPCVGSELAAVLDAAPGAPALALLPMTAYVVGVCLLTLAAGALIVAWPRLSDALESVPVTRGASLSGVLIGGFIALGWWGELVDELLRRSSV